MTPSIIQIMEGIEARLAAIEGLRVYEYVPDSVNVPAAIVGVPDIPEYRVTFGRGRFRLAPTVTILVSASLDRIGQRALAGYADVSGPTSIPAAIDATPRTLGGIVEECYVNTFRPLGMDEVGAIGYYGGVFELVVIAPGK